MEVVWHSLISGPVFSLYMKRLRVNQKITASLLLSEFPTGKCKGITLNHILMTGLYLVFFS